MAREFAKAFYNSGAWKRCRKSYISYRKTVDGGMCETCHEVPGYIVHHKEELTPDNINDPEITLNFKNLKYDCQVCHNQENGRGSGNKIEGMVEYIFDPEGNPVPIPP